MKMLTFGSLFSGAGGIDLGLEISGMRCVWQVENSNSAIRCLERHWPDVTRYPDATTLSLAEIPRVDLVCGGDPCPSRSRARRIHKAVAPDLWPVFRAVVSALRPVWVLRENVVSPDVGDVAADLARLGYLCVVLECDSAQVTGQSRPREYLCGVLESTGVCPVELFSERPGDSRDLAADDLTETIATCLTARRKRFDHGDNYILENGCGLRILDHHERERLQGFDAGWTDGLPARERLIGNAATVVFPEWIGTRILESVNGGQP